MNTRQSHRGGAPVGTVAELSGVEAGAVLYLRLWCDGPEAQQQVWNDFSSALGPSRGRAALQSLEQLCDLCARHGRRPLMRHHLTCACLGGDESCFANIVASAVDDAQEDALMMAMLIVRADVAPGVVGLARQLGLALLQMTQTAATPRSDRARATLH